jgi:hypothetical protein
MGDPLGSDYQGDMMLIYKQTTGETTLDGHFEGLGYSGAGEARNNPDMEAVPDEGPIPRGRYEIGPKRDSPTLGPIVFDLTPVGHDAHGRTEFRIHGDNVNHDASHGCIILGRSIRERIWDDGEKELEVVL